MAKENPADHNEKRQKALYADDKKSAKDGKKRAAEPVGDKGDADKGDGKETAMPVKDRHSREREDTNKRHASERADMNKRQDKELGDMADRHSDEMQAEQEAAMAGQAAPSGGAPAMGEQGAQ